MRITVENLFNPHRYYLSQEAKKRLGWMYILEREAQGNVTHAAIKIGVSRQWLSALKAAFEKYRRDPRSLEPKSRAPRHTENRKRISKEKEQKIIETRDSTPGWGEEKIAAMVWRKHRLKVGHTTVGRYLKKHCKIDPKISAKNHNAWMKKLRRELYEKTQPSLKVKYRPPKAIKDLAPGALVEKDMKFIPKYKEFISPQKYKAKENFMHQHTMIDSFTRIRTLELAQDADSASAAQAYRKAARRFPFQIACINSDNGGENGKDFSAELQTSDVLHFFSNVGTPTDNPRVERSHLTDDKEFYRKGNSFLPFEKQEGQLIKWEHQYNYERPHQALGYLTPMEFYQLWKNNPDEAQTIARKWQNYLARQRKRLYSARRMKRKEQIENLMQFIDAKLNKKVELKIAKQSLINCQLCSWG